MPTPATRTPIRIARGTYANLLASVNDIVDGEIVYATDQDTVYVKEGGTLVASWLAPSAIGVSVQGYDADTAKTDVAQTFTASQTLGNQNELRLGEATANGTNYVGLKAPASIAADTVWTLPSGDGTSGQSLQTNGSGVLSWATPVATSLVDAKGDLLVGTADNTVSRLAVGSNNQVLTADSSTASGLKWATGPGVELIGTVSGAASATKSFENFYSANYSQYFLVLQQTVYVSTLSLRFGKDSTNSYASNSFYGYDNRFHTLSQSTASFDVVGATTSLRISRDNSGSSNCAGLIYINLSQDSNFYPSVWGTTMNATTTCLVRGGYYGNTAFDRFQLFDASGSNISGVFKLYGIKA